ncbi:MAG: hypothetical protein ACPGLV_10050, partial [Bacteroidia bacterium]
EDGRWFNAMGFECNVPSGFDHVKKVWEVKNEAKKLKDDKKGLDKLLRLSVLGTALIITVYSVYYYANAYKYSSTNLFDADLETDINILPINKVNEIRNDKNYLFTNNQEHAIFKGSAGWAVSNNTLELPFINERTTTVLSGLTNEGFQEIFADALNKKYHNAPPILITEKEGISVRSIQFEHFVFPYHAMINWRDTLLYKSFSFYTDSLGGELTIGANGFIWSSGLHGEYLKVIQKSANDYGLNELIDFEGATKIEVIKMPVVDFDVLFSMPSQLGEVFINHGDKREVVESKGELKMLIGPSLKQNNAYTVETTNKPLLEIKPPFLIELGKVESQKPYFFAFLANEKLLLK